MNYLINLKAHLINEIKKTEKVLAATRVTRDNSPTAMESHSDTSRSRLESEVTMHELRLKELKDTTGLIPGNSNCAGKIGLWCYAKVQLPSNDLEIIIVPEGLGGTRVGEIQCVSSKTPIGSALMGKKQGEKFSFNGTSGKVLLIA